MGQFKPTRRNAARARPAAERASLYQEITDKIIDELERGGRRWRHCGSLPAVSDWQAALIALVVVIAGMLVLQVVGL